MFLARLAMRVDVLQLEPFERMEQVGKIILLLILEPSDLLAELGVQRAQDGPGQVVILEAALTLLVQLVMALGFEHQARRLDPGNRVERLHVGKQQAQAVERVELVVDGTVEREIDCVSRGLRESHAGRQSHRERERGDRDTA